MIMLNIVLLLAVPFAKGFIYSAIWVIGCFGTCKLGFHSFHSGAKGFTTLGFGS